METMHVMSQLTQNKAKIEVPKEEPKYVKEENSMLKDIINEDLKLFNLEELIKLKNAVNKHIDNRREQQRLAKLLRGDK